MGTYFAKSKESESRIIMVGLDSAGKTTILHSLKMGDIVTTVPTLGMNVETVQYKSVSFTCWDVGGKDMIRPLWRHYYQNAVALVFVIDSADRCRMQQNTEELTMFLNEAELMYAVLLIFANKQDLPHAMDLMQLAEKLKLANIGRPWFMQASCALTGDGVFEGLDWLSSTLDLLNVKRKQKQATYRADPSGEGTSWLDRDTYRILMENRQKSILCVCGWVRHETHKHTLYIASSITQLVHQFYQEDNIDYDKSYSFHV